MSCAKRFFNPHVFVRVSILIALKLKMSIIYFFSIKERIVDVYIKLFSRMLLLFDPDGLRRGWWRRRRRRMIMCVSECVSPER